MARTFTGQEAKQTRQYFIQLISDFRSKQEETNGYWDSLPDLVEKAKIAKAADSVANEYVDVIAHEGMEELARKLRASGYDTLDAARIHRRDVSNYDRSDGAQNSYQFIKNAIKRYTDTLLPETAIFLDEDVHTNELNQLVFVSYQYLESLPHLRDCASLYAKHQQSISQALKNLLPGTNNAFMWLFVSQEEKQAAQEAYEYLTSMKQGDFGALMERGIDGLKSAHLAEMGVAWAGYRKKPNEFIQMLGEVAPRSVFRSPESTNSKPAKPFNGGSIRGLIERVDKSADTLLTISEYTDEKLRSLEIRDLAKALAAQEALATLGGVPIDELNRDKKGIRINALKNAGYTTVADLATASAYDLASVKGISLDSAHTIKQEYKALSAQVLSSAKIRLSTDRKDDYSSALVLAIYKYLRKRELSSVGSAFHANHFSNIDKQIDLLRRSGGDVGWLLAPASERKLVIDAYNAFDDLVHGQSGKECSSIIDSYGALAHATADAAWHDFEQRPVQYINVLEDIVPELVGNDGLYGLPEELAREIQDQCYFPDGLLCQLRRYQEWGVKYTLHQEKVLLGDEMGLGKTVQAIATMVSLKNTGETHFMVVCPASVLSNWCREIRKMSRLRAVKVHGADRDSALKHWAKSGGVAVTTYETTGRIKLKEGFKFGLLVVDEAHYIKNANAKRSKNVKRLCGYTDRLMFMTGTALENKVDEMVALIDLLQPEIARKVRGIEALSSAPMFRQLVAPVYYRRKREDVLTELPDLEEIEEWCELGPEEEEAYEHSVYGRSFAEARRVSWNVDDISASCKANRLKELVEQAEAEGRKVLVFTFFLDTIKKVIEALGNRCMSPINGSVNPQRRQEIIDEFDNAAAGSVLVAQIQSGGTGLNIQSASVVVICEPQLKPSIENQAVSRAYRMGQTRKVLVYRLLCEDTIDERITRLLAKKQEIFDAFADKSVAAKESIELDDKAMRGLIDEEIERINEKKGRKTPSQGMGADPAVAAAVNEQAAAAPVREFEPASFVMPKGIQGGTLYVYDGRPVQQVKDGQEIVVGTILTPITMTSSATGATFEGDEDSVCFTYKGRPVGFLGSKRAGQVRRVAQRHGGAVSFWCTRDGDYMEGVPKLVPLLPDDAWFYADEEGIPVHNDELCATYSIADYCWTPAAPELEDGERCRIDLSITFDGNNLSIRNGCKIIASVPEKNNSRAGLEAAAGARFRAAWMDMKIMSSGYERKRICFVIDE